MEQRHASSRLCSQFPTFSRFLILQLSTSSKLISSPRREIFLLQVSENSCTQPELQPASFLLRSAMRPNASLTYSNTLGSAVGESAPRRRTKPPPLSGHRNVRVACNVRLDFIARDFCGLWAGARPGSHVNQLYPLERCGDSITDAINFRRVRVSVESADQMVEYWLCVLELLL